MLEKVEILQSLADMAAQGGETVTGLLAYIPESDGSQDVLEEETAYGERIVDGIYHHGYAGYEITDEDELFLTH